MSRSVTSPSRIALILAAALTLGACSSDETPGDPASGADPGHTSSSAGLPNGHVDAGGERAKVKGKATGQACVECHGATGNEPLDPSYPKLGGQYRDYLAHSLQMYRDGEREHPLMSSQAKDLSDQEIADLAAYFAAQASQLHDLKGVHEAP